jgi:hypothetical protein
MVSRTIAFCICLVVAVVAAAAPAAAHVFHIEVAPGFVAGEQTGSHVFAFPSGTKVTCGEAALQATTSSTTLSELKFLPVYKKCIVGETPAPITTNGCTYRVSGKTDAAEHGAVTIECEAGKYIQIDVGTVCWARVQPQTASKGVHFVNEGSGTTRDFRMSMTLTEIKFETGGGVFCPGLLGSGGLSLTGTITAMGFQDLGGSLGERRGTWVE